MMRPATVLMADDHPIVTEGLRRVLEPAFEIVGTVADGHTLVQAARSLRPAIIIVDVSMPVLNGIEAVRQIRKTDRTAKILFLSMHADPIYASEAFLAGGSAYLLKTSVGVEILAALGEVVQGRHYVSSAIDRPALEAQLHRDRRSRSPLQTLPVRQRQVVEMIVQGQSTREIARVLKISPRTVEFHRHRAMKILGVHTTAELVQYAIKHNLIVRPG